MNSLAKVWQPVEVSATAKADFVNPYTDVTVWIEWQQVGGNGTPLRRPAYWDGGNTWRVRFAPPTAGQWVGKWFSQPADEGLVDEATIDATPYDSAEPLLNRGLLRMSSGGRSVIHADGTSWLMVADTAWALPWRATEAQAEAYAADRRSKGFNAALLMTVQPDMKAVGPRDRTALDGFDVGFEDLSDGHLNQMNVSYFQNLDRLMAILLRHGIVPVYQPVFHGYGWKGLDTAGRVVGPAEYARYCRYLVARYGASPAIWLIGADGHGTEPGVSAGGREVEQWDCYRQPTGMHYAPMHHANINQGERWLDFQWCQTGHLGEHLPERVAEMTRNLPTKAVANGEPTYERIGHPDRGVGWWQGHEAWANLCAGGTMGVVYGAGSLWQWRLTRDEAHAGWCCAEHADWRDALAFEGSNYVGIVGKIFAGLPCADMREDFITTLPAGRALVVPGRLLVKYQEFGDGFAVLFEDVPRNYRVHDPRTGEVIGRGQLGTGARPRVELGRDRQPRVVVFCDEFAESD
ncbi:MAG TPA: DUF4038 domain-containing protein [Tepidisphaeraceae bacterium]|jgi:hypothetical protein|nr:DUF4038 domain-containing protein [Tepidisphaeraceae bacterium]